MAKILQIVGKGYYDKVHNSCEVYDIKTINLDKLVNEFSFLNGDTLNVKGVIYTYKKEHTKRPMYIKFSGGDYIVSHTLVTITNVKTKKDKYYTFYYDYKGCYSYYRKLNKSDIEFI